MLSGKKEPDSIPCHQIIICLLLSRPTKLHEKLNQLLDAICYQVAPNEIQESELHYIFHLVYQYVQVSANFKITDFQTETLICQKCFPDQQSLCSITELAEQIATKTEV